MSRWGLLTLMGEILTHGIAEYRLELPPLTSRNFPQSFKYRGVGL
jgi:hypothetical protein